MADEAETKRTDQSAEADWDVWRRRNKESWAEFRAEQRRFWRRAYVGLCAWALTSNAVIDAVADRLGL